MHRSDAEEISRIDSMATVACRRPIVGLFANVVRWANGVDCRPDRLVDRARERYGLAADADHCLDGIVPVIERAWGFWLNQTRRIDDYYLLVDAQDSGLVLHVLIGIGHSTDLRDSSILTIRRTWSGAEIFEHLDQLGILKSTQAELRAIACMIERQPEGLTFADRTETGPFFACSCPGVRWILHETDPNHNR